MRRNFSLPRLAIVVAWAAFAPQSRWSELFPTAIAPDMGPTSPSEAGAWMPWNWGYNSSTAAESYLRGSAALTQAAGQYHYNTALGQSLAEDAHAKAIANRQSVVDSYYRLKQTNAAWQNQARSPRLSPEAQLRISTKRTPARLSAEQLDPVTGAIRWPGVLMQSPFDFQRDGVDAAWNQRDASPQSSRQIEMAVGQLEAALQARIRAVTPADYIAARKFLASLRYEARQAPAQASVVMR